MHSFRAHAIEQHYNTNLSIHIFSLQSLPRLPWPAQHSHRAGFLQIDSPRHTTCDVCHQDFPVSPQTLYVHGPPPSCLVIPIRNLLTMPSSTGATGMALLPFTRPSRDHRQPKQGLCVRGLTSKLTNVSALSPLSRLRRRRHPLCAHSGASGVLVHAPRAQRGARPAGARLVPRRAPCLRRPRQRGPDCAGGRSR